MRYILAVSGGRDSMLLAHCFAQLHAIGNIDATPVVYHLDHGLRVESEADADFVCHECRLLNLPVYLSRLNVRRFAERARIKSLEAAGRSVRYRQLRRLSQNQANSVVVTAHHADDYLESVLIHLIRGGGPDAFGTLPVWRELEGMVLLRPLVKFARSEIDRLVAHYDIAYREDASNQSTQFLRNRLRHKVLPHLYQEGLDPVRVWRNFHNQYDSIFLEDNSTLSTERKAASSVPARLEEAAGEDVNVGYLALDRRLLAGNLIGEWKTLLDFALRRLSLPPMDEKMFADLRAQRNRHAERGSRFRLIYTGNRVVIWSDTRGPIWIMRADAAALRVFKSRSLADNAVEIVYNGLRRVYTLKSHWRVTPYEPGLRYVVRGSGPEMQTRKLKKLYQERGIPRMIRTCLPLIQDRRTGMIVCICFSFWENGTDRI
ncbi:MAG: tRNA lysidine(34) synthetase TilS, partial [Leptospiraceae bacterium]|nr:tRNA lysidine(34) synthetase TilS [Leptospiraceae bacterium]